MNLNSDLIVRTTAPGAWISRQFSPSVRAELSSFVTKIKIRDTSQNSLAQFRNLPSIFPRDIIELIVFRYPT
jgi:hypothetical protein